MAALDTPVAPLSQPARPAQATPPPLEPLSGVRAACGAAPSPDTATKGLIGAIDTLAQQQQAAEAARHAAEQAAAAAGAEAEQLKAQLNAALRCAAELDDAEQAVQAQLEARLQQQAAREEQLRLVCRQLSGLRAAGSGEEHAAEMRNKGELAGELQRRLLAQGVDPATVAQLCDGAAHSCVAGDGAQQLGAGGGAAPRRPVWLGSGGGCGGLLGGLGFRRRGGTAG